MGTINNLLDVLRGASNQDIENEAAREVAIAIAGNTTELRDRLHRALSTRLESLWTPSPFRLIDTNERPVIREDDSATGLLLYVINQGDRIPSEKRRWISELAKAPGLSIILVVLDRNSDKVFNNQTGSGVGQRLQSLNPIRLVGGREVTGPSQKAAADGAAFNNAEVETQPTWQLELENLRLGAVNKITVVELPGLELNQLQVQLLPLIVKKLSNRELALARRAPIFRNTVAQKLIQDTARSNTSIVVMANATAGIPLISGFLDNGGDFVALTKNQFELSHRLAEVYGQKRDNRVELYLELVPILGMAFLWKGLSQMLAGRLPKVLSVAPKSGIALSATFLVGWAAQLYYSSGRKAPGQVAAFVRSVVERFTGQRSGSTSDAGENPRQLRSS